MPSGSAAGSHSRPRRYRGRRHPTDWLSVITERGEFQWGHDFSAMDMPRHRRLRTRDTDDATSGKSLVFQAPTNDADNRERQRSGSLLGVVGPSAALRTGESGSRQLSPVAIAAEVPGNKRAPPAFAVGQRGARDLQVLDGEVLPWRFSPPLALRRGGKPVRAGDAPRLPAECLQSRPPRR